MVTAIESTATTLINSNGGATGAGNPNGILPTSRTLYLGPNSNKYDASVAPTTAISSAGTGSRHLVANFGYKLIHYY